MQDDRESNIPPDAYFEGLLKHREALLQLRSDQLRTFDKAILGVSGGALGLSIAFLDKISGSAQPFTTFMVWSWACFSGAVALNIISYLTGSEDAMREIGKIDECIRQAKEYETRRNLFRGITNSLNIIALMLFLCGVILLTTHAYVSLQGGSNGIVQRSNTPATDASADRVPEWQHFGRTPTTPRSG